MSEYQYYEFQSIDRVLTEKEMNEISMMSSRVELNPHRAVFVYNYGDYRCLYLGWLKSNDHKEDDDERLEPTVPSGLGTLPKSLEQFVEFFDIDPDLIAVAAEGMPRTS